MNRAEQIAKVLDRRHAAFVAMRNGSEGGRTPFIEANREYLELKNPTRIAQPKPQARGARRKGKVAQKQATLF